LSYGGILFYGYSVVQPDYSALSRMRKVLFSLRLLGR